MKKSENFKLKSQLDLNIGEIIPFIETLKLRFYF